MCQSHHKLLLNFSNFSSEYPQFGQNREDCKRGMVGELLRKYTSNNIILVLIFRLTLQTLHLIKKIYRKIIYTHYNLFLVTKA